MLPLFPPSSLDNSILTSVLVGLLVVWVFHETLGWGLSGLVVPGYVASILLIEPTTAMVVLFEALATFAIVSVLSERVPHWWPWTRLFGRDRFLLFLLVSVGVRLLLEAGGYAWLAEATGIRVLAGLHSMGLVLVPLAANAMWRAGLGATTRLGVPILVTWGIVAVLLRYTNLSLSSFALTYEDLALDFVSSPRAYILLLVGATIGSAVNLRWGWDFGGIIIPGLLALCWLEPHRLAATLGEVIVLTLLVRLVLRVPGLKGANLTGGRPLVLAFTVAYLVKFGLGWLFGGASLGVSGRDVFGFGYLLTALLTVRAVRYGDLARVLVPAVVTSFGSFVVATALGAVLGVLLPVDAKPAGGPVLVAGAPSRTDLLAAAWTSTGAAPTGVLALVERGEPGLLSGGEGFGALAVRGGAGPVVSGRIGSDGAGLAALALAEVLDARAVHLCAPEGEACEAARAELRRRHTVLVVEAGNGARLALPREAVGLDLARLGERLPGLAVDAGAPELHLSLDPSSRYRLAAERFGADPGPMPDLATLPPPEVAREQVVGVGARRVLQGSVMTAWMRWRAGGEDGEASLRVATGLALELGLSLGRTGERSALVGNGWAAVQDRSGSALVVEAPALAEEPASAVLAWELFRSMGAGLVVLDQTARRDHRDGAGPARGDREAHGALLGGLAALGEAAAVVTARTATASTEPGADVVLSIGRPTDDDGDAPPILRRVGDLFEDRGVRVVTWDGSARRLPYADPVNGARAAAALAAGREAQVTVYATPRWLERSDQSTGAAAAPSSEAR